MSAQAPPVSRWSSTTTESSSSGGGQDAGRAFAISGRPSREEEGTRDKPAPIETLSGTHGILHLASRDRQGMPDVDAPGPAEANGSTWSRFPTLMKSIEQLRRTGERLRKMQHPARRAL
ncbi:hypothetical protein OIO90_004711 [Microbotryomycetes sp. JL221]|nr:hypothetical protein OIO90_004711 [Microbotryomycetes sp. JL221]